MGEEELLVGAVVAVEDDADPVLPLDPVLSLDPVLPESSEPAEVLFEELWVFVVAADFDAEDSWATTTPRKTVAPAAAAIAPRVIVRTRAWARSRSLGVFGWMDSDMW